ncbi:hypothetical protein ILYODFUR_030403 [Ilyodon furcidens]|uniref:Uncharacterized protein n=1 Tax=Ilyodon furcidens TaxID=33524 RepID=A0ABV0VIF9_9TELE
MTSVHTRHRKQAGPADGELVMSLSELCADEYPQQLFDCPFSFPSMDELPDPDSDRPSAPLQLQSQPSDQCSEWAHGNPPFHRDDNHSFLNSCFYQLHMHGRPLVSDGRGCGAAGGGDHASHRLQVEFNLPSTSASSPTVLSSNFQAIGSLLHP